MQNKKYNGELYIRFTNELTGEINEIILKSDFIDLLTELHAEIFNTINSIYK